jgi:DNA-binding transcriptional regulator YiaG
MGSIRGMTEALKAPDPGARTTRIPEWSFADRIRKIRREVVRVDQAEFARDLGVTKEAYSAWESGRNEPRSILALARKVELVSGVPAATPSAPRCTA